MQAKDRVHFIDISPRSWEHPADKAALDALRAVPGLDILIQKLFGATTERSLRLLQLASSVRVSETQFAELHTMYREAGQVLNIGTMPELYVANNPFLNASAIGFDRPFIVLNSSTVEGLKPDQLMFILGHELGHVLSGHALYKTLLAVLMRLLTFAIYVPLGAAPLMAIIMALLEWDRKSELTADRAGLLVLQETMGAYKSQMQLAGGAGIDKMNINEFFVQAAEYEAGENIVDSLYKMINLAFTTHPFPVLRVVELKKWVDSGMYGAILNGEYKRRGGEDNQGSVFDSFREAGKQYREDFQSSTDPLMKIFAGAADVAEGAADRGREFFESLFKNRRSNGASNGGAAAGEDDNSGSAEKS